MPGPEPTELRTEPATELIAGLRAALAAGRTPDPQLCRRLQRLDDVSAVRRAGKLLAGLPDGAPGLRPVGVHLITRGTAGALPDLLRAQLVAAGMAPRISVAPYGSFRLTLALAATDPAADVTLLLLDETLLLPADVPLTAAELDAAVSTRLAELRDLVAGYVRRSSGTLVLHTVPLPAQLVDAVVGWRERAALQRLWYRVNGDLLGLAQEHPQVVCVDLVGLLAGLGVPARDERLFLYADLPYTDAALLVLARQVRRVASARSGLTRKVLALDLDDTLWGGVLGEVGADGVALGGLYPGNAYLALQRTVLRLREQGVVLVLASKNDAGAVDAALAGHPEMLLRADSFAVRVVNWADKAGNLQAAADTLGLTIDAFVFMDDSPFERAQVGAELPQVALVAADGDPANLVDALTAEGWFDVLELTETDQRRPDLYRARAVRSQFATSFGSSADFLRALELRFSAEPVTEFTVPRAVQLGRRTNQFNLTTTSFDETTTAVMAEDPEHLVATFAVADRFGDEGIVAAVWVDGREPVWQVLNLVLSCRTLGRGVELAIARWVEDQARAAGAVGLDGRFVPSGRNAVAADFWIRAGYTPGPHPGTFHLDLSGPARPGPEWILSTERTTI